MKTDIDPSLLRVLPHDVMAEKAILGGLMLDNNALAEVLQILEPDGHDFYHTGHRILFRAILTLANEGTIVDTITTCNALNSSGDLEKVGGYFFVSEILDSAISSANIRHYAKIVKDKSVERRIISEATRLIEVAYTPTLPTEEILSEAQKTILSLSLTRDKDTVRTSHDIAKQTHALIESRYERKEGMVIGLSTGFDRLDNLTGGLLPGHLWICAARPGIGKSAFAVNISSNAALDGHPVMISSLEMPSDSIMIRILSGMTGIDSRLLSRGVVRDDQWHALAHATQKIGMAPLFIDDKPDVTPSEIRAKARRMKADHGIELLVVDYLQLMRVPGPHDTREQQVAEISRTLKAIARELNIPVIALSQLNRQVESRPGDKRPNLGDLRESGAIEQDADVIVFIYRDEVYNKSEDNPEKGFAEIIIGKHRNGPPGAVKLRYTAQFTRFENMINQWEDRRGS